MGGGLIAGLRGASRGAGLAGGAAAEESAVASVAVLPIRPLEQGQPAFVTFSPPEIGAAQAIGDAA